MVYTQGFVALLYASTAYAAPTAFRRRDVSFDNDYDYIVVGAGPAGIIAATGFAEAGKKTLLLEGGGPSYYVTGGRQRPSWLDSQDLSRVDVPGLYSSIFADSGNLTCDNFAAAYGGCTIGGSSAINAGLWFQPPDSDWDLYFPDGWRSADVADATARLTARQPSSAITSADGQYYEQSTYDAAKDWLVGHGGFSEVDINADPNAKSSVFGHPIYDYENGQRGGPVVSYLQDALRSEHFSFASGMHVKRVVRSGDRATGVEVTRGDDPLSTDTETIALSSTGRIVLSGGAIQSPGLLMYSGIGDPATLQTLHDAGIVVQPSADWINNTAVGAGLFDNPNTFIEISGDAIASYVYSYDDPPAADRDAYLNSRTGPYTFAGQTSVFWDMVNRTAPDGVTNLVGLQGTIGTAGYQDYTSDSTMTLNVYGTSGLRSRGRVTVDASADYKPGASPTLYQDAQDARDIAAFIRRIFDALPEALTPLNIARDASVDDIASYIATPSAYAAGQVNHWSSSCAIGPCVDANAQVLGMQNLHVVDASILQPLTVNPQMGVMIAAEHAVDRILKL